MKQSIYNCENPRKPVLGMILKGYPRISETFISNEILLLEKQGFRIHLFSMRHPRESFSHESIAEIKATVDYLPQTILGSLLQLLYHNIMTGFHAPGRYSRAMKLAFKRFLRTRKTATIKHLLQAGYLVHKLMPNTRVNHLHAHFAHSPTSVAMFAAQLTGLDFSFTAHAKDIYTSDNRQLREKMNRAKFVVTCTEYNKLYLRRIARNSTIPIYRSYHGIDVSLFSTKPNDIEPSKPYQLLTIARLVPKKGLPVVYKALKHLKNISIDFQHTLIGDGDDREQLSALVHALDLTGNCHWLGTQPHDIVLKHLQKADLFVLGCQISKDGDRDGIPNVFMESMAMGVPVVATNVSAIPELIQDGKTGLLVPPGSPKKMADAIQRLLTDMELRKRVIKSGRLSILQSFDNQKLNQDLAAIFRKEQPALH